MNASCGVAGGSLSGEGESIWSEPTTSFGQSLRIFLDDALLKPTPCYVRPTWFVTSNSSLPHEGTPPSRRALSSSRCETWDCSWEQGRDVKAASATFNFVSPHDCRVRQHHLQCLRLLDSKRTPLPSVNSRHGNRWARRLRCTFTPSCVMVTPKRYFP